jgi:SAM-dependent methyltransferase
VSGTDENNRLWDSFSRANALNPAQRHRWRLIVRELSRLPPGALVMDLGCGSGALLQGIAEKRPDARLAGVDAAPAALAIARRRLPRAQFFEADLDGEGFSFSEPVDAVVCSELIEHLDRPQRALELARKLLRPAGLMVVTVPSGPMNEFDRSIGHRRHYSLGEMERLFEAAGFVVVRAYRWGFPIHTAFRIAISAVPAAVSQFSDEKIGFVQMAAFKTLYAAFYANIRSRHVGRQIVAVAMRG